MYVAHRNLRRAVGKIVRKLRSRVPSETNGALVTLL